MKLLFCIDILYLSPAIAPPLNDCFVVNKYSVHHLDDTICDIQTSPIDPALSCNTESSSVILDIRDTKTIGPITSTIVVKLAFLYFYDACCSLDYSPVDSHFVIVNCTIYHLQL